MYLQIIGLALGAALGAATPLAGTDQPGAIREAYSGESTLPDAIAYVEYLRLLADFESTNSRAFLHLLGDAFGVARVDELSPDQARRLAARGTMLTNHYRSIRLEEAELKIRILCAPDSFDNRPAKAYRALNAADDVTSTVRNKYLLIALSELGGDERLAFTAFLDNFKKSVTYVKTDNRPDAGIEGAVPNHAADHVKAICQTLEADYHSLARQGGR